MEPNRGMMHPPYPPLFKRDNGTSLSIQRVTAIQSVTRQEECHGLKTCNPRRIIICRGVAIKIGGEEDSRYG